MDKNAQKYLKGLEFPATKQDIIDQANDNDAPDEFMAKLDDLDEKEYASMSDVTDGMMV